MNFWTKFGMAVGGGAAAALAIPTGGASVGVFAAAAVSTAAAAGTAAAAAAAGAAAGATIGHIIDKKKEEAYQKGHEEAKAKAELKIKKMEELVNKLCASVHQANEHYQFTIALIAVGLAAAKSVGRASPEDKNNIEEFVAGISCFSLPDKVQAVIKKYKQTPPSMHEAIEEVRKIHTVAPTQFKEVILLAFGEDGENTSAGKMFLKEWNQEFA